MDETTRLLLLGAGNILFNGAYSFAIGCASNAYGDWQVRKKASHARQLGYESVGVNHDLERGVRKAQLRATYQVAKRAAEQAPRNQSYFNSVAKALLDEVERVDSDDYTFSNMPRLNTDEVKKLLPNISIDEDELGWRLKLGTLAELKQRFGSDPAFETLEKLLLTRWKDGESEQERVFDWFDAFSACFAEERKDNPALKAAFDGHLLTEMANQLELDREHLQMSVDMSTEVLLQSVREDGALTRAKIAEVSEQLKPIADRMDLLLERSKPQDWSLPKEALLPDANHLPQIEAPFVFPLSLGVEVAGQPREEDRHRTPYEALNYSEDASVYRGRRREPRPASQVLNEWLRQPGVHVVTGEPGGGKTTLLSHWARTLHQDYLQNDERAFPLYIPLREMRSVDKAILRDKGVQYYFESTGWWNYRVDVSLFRSGGRSAVWLLDGWDELEPSQQRDWQTIIGSLEGVVIVSCRVAQYKNEFGRDHIIMGLSGTEQTQFLERLTPFLQSDSDAYSEADERWRTELLREVNKHSHLRQLASSPLLLNLLAQINPPGNVQLPKKRSDFYQEALDTMLERRLPDLKGRQKRVLKRALVEIARQAKLNLSISEDTLWDALDEVGASDEAEEQLRSSGVLRPKGRSYEFLHATFQEWSLAQALYQDSTLFDAVKAHWRQPNYEETLALLWGITFSDDDAVSPEERLAATDFLLTVGCQNQLNERNEEQENRKRSGILTALHLWHKSGVPVEKESLERLRYKIQNSRSAGNLRALAVAIDDTVSTELLELDLLITSYYALLSNSNTSERVLLELMKDESTFVRQGVARHPNMTESMLLELMKDEDKDVRWGVAGNPNATESMLLELIKDEDKDVRWGVAGNPNTTESMLLELMKDENTFVRRGVAINPNTTESMLLELMKDEGWDVRQGVAGNPNMTESMLLELIKDEDKDVRWGVAGNPNATESMLLELIKDEDKDVRWGVAGNPNATESMLLELIKDEDKDVRWGVTWNPNATESMLLELIKDEDKDVRWGVAGNPNTTESMLLELMKDENTFVRRGVAINLNMTESMLLELMKDEDEDVRQDVARNPNICLEWL